ncbi:DUF362 domain-containing protein [bacterium]|nr:DUF362 domain-containing protein [bacterium]
MDRRDFLLASLLASLGPGVTGCRSNATPAASADGAVPGKVGRNRWRPGPVNGVDLAVARGTSAQETLKAALGVFGGMKAFIQPGDRVVIKPNLAWSRTPEQAACTSPEVLAAVIAACRDAGARDLIVGEHACDVAAVVFDLSGARAVCAQAGIELVDWSSPQLYREQALAQGQTLKADQIATDLLDCDVYINLPTLKHHSASTVTLALKNQMGCVQDRGRYHSERGAAGANNLHRNVVDLATALRPTLNILDATRALKTGGPKGPGVVEQLDTICVSPNIVAVDAYGARLLGHDPLSIPHLAMAAAAGLGEAELNKIQMREV